MPTDYTKLRDLCPALDKADADAARKFPPLLVPVVVDTASTVANEALAAQPDLARATERAEKTSQRANDAGDRSTADRAFIEAHELKNKSMQNLRDACRMPGPPLVS